MSLLDPVVGAECLYTTVRNVSLTEKFFGFLPPHGRRMACGDELTVWGDIQTWQSRFTPNTRHQRGLEHALVGQTKFGRTINQALVIVSTPAVHLYDATLDVTKIIELDNSILDDVDPCWGAYSSSSLACT